VQVGEATLHVERTFKPEAAEVDLAPQASQIVPTQLELTVFYIPGARHARLVTWTSTQGRNWTSTWE
jgi:hypothetical protein